MAVSPCGGLAPVEVEAAQAVAHAEECAAACAAELELVVAALDATVAGVQQINEGAMAELCTFRDPPRAVKLVVHAACVLCNLAPAKAHAASDAGSEEVLQSYWELGSKELLGASGLKERLLGVKRASAALRVARPARAHALLGRSANLTHTPSPSLVLLISLHHVHRRG